MKKKNSIFIRIIKKKRNDFLAIIKQISKQSRIIIFKKLAFLLSFNEFLFLYFSLKLNMSMNNSLKSIEIWDKINEKFGEISSPKVYLFISKAYAKVADFIKADHYIKKYHAKYKENNKTIYFQRKLLYGWALHSMNYRKLYHSDGNMLYAPGWDLVAGLYNDSPLSIKKKWNANFIKELMHSNIFLAIELRDKMDVIGAISAFKKIFFDNDQKLSGGFLEYFFSAIEKKYYGKISSDQLQKDLLEKIQVVESGILSCNTWIGIYNILIFNSLLRSGLAARKKAVEQSFFEADDEPDNARKVERAAFAALDSGEFLLAERYIANLKPLIDNNKYKEIKAYYYLLNGDLERSRSFLGKKSSNSDRSSAEYFKGKSVAIVGPAPNGISSGEEIDSFDIVIRFNYTGIKPAHNYAEFGNKTNITLYARNFLKMDSITDLNFLNDLDFYIVKFEYPEFVLADLKAGRAKMLLKNRFFFNKNPNAVQCILFHVLHYEPKKIKVFKSNFFLSEKPYAENYSGLGNKSSVNKLPNTQGMLTNHDLISQTSFVRSLWKCGLIEVDENCADVLKLTDEEYMCGMETLM